MERTVATVQTITQSTGVSPQALPNNDSQLLAEHINNSDLLINGTSVGMDGTSLPLLAAHLFPRGTIGCGCDISTI